MFTSKHQVLTTANSGTRTDTNRQEVESGEGDVCYPEYTHQVGMVIIA